MSEILLVGKYAGFSFSEILKKDLPYCQFMKSLKFTKPSYQQFIEFLNQNLDTAIEEKKLESIAKIMKK